MVEKEIERVLFVFVYRINQVFHDETNPTFNSSVYMSATLYRAERYKLDERQTVRFRRPPQK